MNAEYRHFLTKALDAHRGGRDSWSVRSTGEKLAVALALSKPEWIAYMGYTFG